MIIAQSKEGDKIQREEEQYGPLGSSSEVQAPPPAFEEEQNETDHLLGDFTNGGIEDVERGPPPDFTQYNAEHFEIGDEDVVSHDPHLNSDGEALYRFLFSQSEIFPIYRLHCCGTHTETRHRWVTHRNQNGQSESRMESHTESITDFDFYIEIQPDGKTDPIQWSAPDEEARHRGRMVREVEQPLNNAVGGSTRRKATKNEIKRYRDSREQRKTIGSPPWVGKNYWTRNEPAELTLRSSKTLRQWADEYCASPKYLKEFVYEKVLYGWNLQQLEFAIRATIAATPYQGNITVEFETRGSKVYIRPDNKISRMLSNKWLTFLSIILFIYPFIWLFKRFHSRGGGIWDVCGCAYPLKRSPFSVSTQNTGGNVDLLPTYSPGNRLQSTNSLVGGSSPPVRDPELGVTEGDWFRKWEPIIMRMVLGKYQSTTPLIDPQRQRENILILFDGTLN